ncbi:MAG: cupin domain-containing protein, partial [Motilibacteraceae bacterium]
EVGDQVSDDALVDLLVEGTTVVLQGLHRTWPPVRALAGQLAEDLGHPVQVNAYLTPASSRGFAPHYDVHDVFVLQLAGEKRWRIHRPVHPDPLRHQPWTDRPEAVAAAAAGGPLLDVVLRPGDSLYLPRGFLHAAEALGEVSAHLTIGVHPVTRYALVEALLRAAADDPALRGSLPLGADVTDPAAMAPHVRDVVGALAASLRADSDGPWEEVIARVTAEVGDTAVRATRPAPLGPFAQAAAVEALELGTLLCRREHLRAAVRREAGRLAVVLPTKRLDLPLEVEPAVRRVLSGQPVAVRDLPGLDDTDRFVLARRLLREGVAVPVPAP